MQEGTRSSNEGLGPNGGSLLSTLKASLKDLALAKRPSIDKAYKKKR